MLVKHESPPFAAFCPADPTKPKVGDYYFERFVGTKNQADARDYCATTFPGSRLAKPETIEELNELLRIAGKIQYPYHRMH